MTLLIIFLPFNDMVDIDHSVMVALDLYDPNRHWVFSLLVASAALEQWMGPREAERGKIQRNGGQ